MDAAWMWPNDERDTFFAETRQKCNIGCGTHERMTSLKSNQPTKSPPPATKALEQASISNKQVFGRSHIQHQLGNFSSGITKNSSPAERSVLYWNFFICSSQASVYHRRAHPGRLLLGCPDSRARGEVSWFDAFESLELHGS